jgi:hypothetical protein
MKRKSKMEAKMKGIIGLIFVFMLIASGVCAAAAPGVCTQSLVSYGTNMKELTFVCTGSTDHSFPATATSTANTTAIKGYYVTDVYTSPGGTAPTDGTAVALNTADSPVWDVLGGVGVCSSTLTKRFLTPVTLPSGGIAANTVRGALSLAISGNSVDSAIVTVKVILWNN